MQIKATLRFDFLFSLSEWMRLRKQLRRKAGEAAGNLHSLLVGLKTGAAIMETSVEHS